MSRFDYTSKDYESLRAALLQLASEKLPEWTDQSPNDLGVMLLELVAAMGDSLFYNQDRIAAESFLETAVERRSLVQLLRLIGYELKPPLAASVDLTLLFKPDAQGQVTIQPFTTFTTTAKTTGTPISFQYVRSTPIVIPNLQTLPLGAFDTSGELKVPPPSASLPSEAAKYLVYRTIPVVQVDTLVKGEVVASSDGSPMQRYALKRAPVVDDTLVVTVRDGQMDEQWKRVTSLFESSNNDPHYSVRRDERGVVHIEFGDGTYGRIPLRGFNNIVASYGVGGGAKGNVPVGAITKPVTVIDKLEMGHNEKPSSGGAEAEDASAAAKRGPLFFRSMGRAVTASDYEVLAKKFGVGKARAFAQSWNKIDLIVAPMGGGFVSDTLKEDLLAFLDSKRSMTTIVDVKSPVYVQVSLGVAVDVLPQFSRSQVQQGVARAVERLFAFENVDFGQTIYLSKIYETIQDLAGVKGAVIKTFARSAPPTLQAPGVLTFEPNEIPVWSGFTSETLVMQGGVSHA